MKDLVHDFNVAQYADYLPGVPAEFTNASWNARSLHTALYVSYRLKLNVLGSTPATQHFRPFGAAGYYEFEVPPQGVVDFSLAGQAGTSALSITYIRRL